MQLIILGASGKIGSQLYRDSIDRDLDVVGTYCKTPVEDLQPFDVKKNALSDLVQVLSSADVVFLLAGQIDQNWVKDNPKESHAINVTALRQLTDEATAAGAMVIFVSSEAIFDGLQGGYTEESTPAPLTVYAKQKLEIENYIQATSSNYCIVRTGWTVGWENTEHDPIFGTYKGLLQKGAKMAEDNIFTLTDVCDTSNALLKLIQQKKQGLYHIAANPPVGRTDLADWIKKSSIYGTDMSYETVKFNELNFSEPRPAKSWISNQKLVEEIDHAFRSPKEIVEAKVVLIDRHFEGPERAPA